jgi:RNA polymerase sigma-70 factor (ECF subfamily)
MKRARRLWPQIGPAALISPMPAAEPDSDDELVRRASDGDRGAFGELYTRYARMVHAILIARVRPAEAEDLVQEVFMQAMHKLSLLRAPGAFRGWIGSIARNRAMDYHRGARQDVELAAYSAAEPPGQDAHHDALVALDAIRKLPEAYRDTLMMRLVEGMTGPEIAERTGMRHDSVRVNLTRGMRLLREQLGGTAR